MKAFLDTSVLIATFYGDHERHDASLDLFLRFGREQSCCGTHSLAEVYAILTGMPGKRRVGRDAALLFVRDIRENLTLVTLGQDESVRFIADAAAVRVDGGAIYDALLGHCAVKANAESLYTWNTRDFLRLSPEVARRVKRPDE